MVRSLRFLLIWLLIALLPMQAIAAGIRMACVVDGDTVATKVVTTYIAQGATPDHHHHHHHGMSADDVDAKPIHNVHNHATDHLKHHKSTTCSSCGSCCIGAFALPEPLSIAHNDAQVVVKIVSPPALVTGFIPNGLERPPRQLSA